MNEGRELKGVTTYIVDCKGKLSIRFFSPEIGEKLVLLHSREGDCIDVYQEKDFNALAEKLLDRVRQKNSKENRDLIRCLSIKYIDTKEVDKQKRIIIPKFALQKYGLSGKVVIEGKNKKLSIYSKEAYSNHIKKLLK